MVGSYSGNTGVQNVNSRIILFINWSKKFLGGTKFPKNIPQESSIIGRSYIINNLCFCGTQSIDLLVFRPVNNCTSRECKIK